MDRRDFLGLTAGTLAAALLARPLAAAAAVRSHRAEVLNAREWQLLEAVCEQILPPVNGVSTRAAGCVNFIDKLLAHEEKSLLPAYRSALAALDQWARTQSGQDLAQLEAATLVPLLEQLEDGVASPWPAQALQPAALFATLRFHTLLGFLASPQFGGNAGGKGWQAIGFPGHLHAGNGVSPEQVSGAQPLPAPSAHHPGTMLP